MSDVRVCQMQAASKQPQSITWKGKEKKSLHRQQVVCIKGRIAHFVSRSWRTAATSFSVCARAWESSRAAISASDSRVACRLRIWSICLRYRQNQSGVHGCDIAENKVTLENDVGKKYHWNRKYSCSKLRKTTAFPLSVQLWQLPARWQKEESALC